MSVSVSVTRLHGDTRLLQIAQQRADNILIQPQPRDRISRGAPDEHRDLCPQLGEDLGVFDGDDAGSSDHLACADSDRTCL